MAFQNLSFSGRFKLGGPRCRIGGFSIIGFCLILLCPANSLCLAQSNQPVVKQISTQLRGFGVPFNINADASEFIEVQLYVTKDQGQSWQFYDRQQTDGEEFAFRAEADGEYWFALKTLDRDKKLLPDGETKPELKVIVDTVKPTLKFNIESDPAGRIVCSWVAQDQYIAPASLKILYRPETLSLADAATGQGWKQVPIQLGAKATDGIYRDRIAWWPEDNVRSYEVRLEIADSAGNTAFQESRVSVPLVAWRNKTQSTAHAGSWAANLFRKQQPAIQPPPQYMRNDFSDGQRGQPNLTGPATTSHRKSKNGLRGRRLPTLAAGNQPCRTTYWLGDRIRGSSGSRGHGSACCHESNPADFIDPDALSGFQPEKINSLAGQDGRSNRATGFGSRLDAGPVSNSRFVELAR